jgi:hypothetical protein
MTAGGEGEILTSQLEGAEVADGAGEFRTTPRQLRNLRIAVVIGIGVGVVAGCIAFIAKSAGATEVAVIGGITGLVFLYSYLAYASARTVFGPDGISGRSLGGRYEYRWEQIDNVACRAYTSRGVTTYSVIMTTTDRDRIRLGAPVSGGVMADPEFATKYAHIRRAWQTATGRTGPEADTKSIWTRGVFLLTAGICIQVVAVAVIASMVSMYGPAFAAHEGRGTLGLFTAEVRNCPRPACTWFGTFTAGRNVEDATLAPGGPFIDQPQVGVAAVNSGAQDTVYPLGGGTAWRAPAAALAVASVVALVVLAAELTVPANQRRRRRRRARVGLGRLSDPVG